MRCYMNDITCGMPCQDIELLDRVLFGADITVQACLKPRGLLGLHL